MLALLTLGAALAAPTAADWQSAYGPPSRSLTEADSVRSAEEPLLVYWMQVQADPLGVGPRLWGTLVANFDPGDSLESSEVNDFTFLAMAAPEQLAALETAVSEEGWVVSEALVERSGGAFRELSLALPDGRTGTLAIRQGEATGQLADGRPSPALWLHVTAL
jgi:hypothetical protein